MRSILRLGGAIALLLVCVPGWALTLTDDFEGETPGSFPSLWMDVGTIDPASTAPDPSATVQATVDAFGAPTRAVKIDAIFAASQGLYVPIVPSRFVSIAVDFRVDQFSNNAAGVATDWALDVGLTQIQGTTDFAVTPALQSYVSSFDQEWHGYFIGTDGTSDFPDYGVGVSTDTWYRLELELDTLLGSTATLVTEIATGIVAVDRVDVVPGWTAADGAHDAVALFDGELTTAADQFNITWLDNIRIVTRVDEPGSLALLLFGAVGLGLLRRRRPPGSAT